MTDETSKPIDLSILPWVEQATGPRLMAYLLGCPMDRLPDLASGSEVLSSRQTTVAATFAQLRAAAPPELDDAGTAALVQAWLTQVSADGVSVARSLHDHVVDGAGEVPPSARDDIERALVTLALNAYAAFLLPPDPVMLPFMEEFSTRVTSLLHHDPQRVTFTDAVLQDSVLTKVFQHESEHTGRYATIYRNTGSGGSLQLIMFPEMLLRSAWRHLSAENESPRKFAEQALSEFKLVRDALAGKSRTITAKLAFMGVLLPPTATLTVTDGTVRPATEADRRLAPESLKAQLTGTDSSGDTTVINYDGDVLLEYSYPYRVKAVDEQLGATPPSWPEDMRPPVALEQLMLRLRFSLMLAVQRPERAQIVPTWRYVDDPLGYGRATSWSDPRQGPGIMPLQLTDDEVLAWGEWYNRLSMSHVARIELALSRILRAIAERREPSDVLIDSVIAWENLFGTKEGEPTFRVTTCLAVLLEESFQERIDLKKKLTDIYNLRSKVVHGSANLRESDYPKCQEALDVAIRAIRVLTTTRADILELADGAARSASLLLATNAPTAPS